MIDRRPGLIADCRAEGDVSHAVKFAAEHGVRLSIFGAGHNIAGNAANDGGLMISLRNMKATEVDPDSRTVRVEPGATLGDLDAATQVHALAVPTGINSTTGVAGLTLGGGFGWLSRKFGMTVDNLLSAQVVLADGSVVTASESENSDLFWGLRGGGGNFGVVTSFEFQAHSVGPEILSGPIVHPFSDAPEVLRAYRDLLKDAPDELTVWTVLRKAPPLPFLPEDVHGTEIVILAAMYTGDMAGGEVALAPLRAIGNPDPDSRVHVTVNNNRGASVFSFPPVQLIRFYTNLGTLPLRERPGFPVAPRPDCVGSFRGDPGLGFYGDPEHERLCRLGPGNG